MEKSNNHPNPETPEAKNIPKGNQLNVAFSRDPKNSRKRKTETPVTPSFKTQTPVTRQRISRSMMKFIWPPSKTLEPKKVDLDPKQEGEEMMLDILGTSDKGKDKIHRFYEFTANFMDQIKNPKTNKN